MRNKKKKDRRKVNSVRDLRCIRWTNIHTVGIKGEKREKDGRDNFLKMAVNFPSSMKDININTPDAQGIPSKVKLKKTNTKTHQHKLP